MLLSLIHNIICGISTCSNLFLLYLMLFHTPKRLRSYSAMLITLCIYELITSFSSFIVFPRIVPLGFEGIVCVYSGPCSHLYKEYTCFLLYTLVLHGFTMYNLQMTANFCFRYYVLKHNDPGVFRVLLANGLLLAPVVICAVFFLQARSPEPLVRKLILRDTPQYDFSSDRLIGLVNLSHSWALPSIFLIVSTALPCTLINVRVGSSVARFLHDHASNFSTRTRSTHHEFLKVLIFQATISQAFLIAVGCYVVGQLNLIRSPLQEYGTHMIGDLCLISSPLLTMYYVQPYRKRVERLFGKSSDKVVSVSVWNDNDGKKSTAQAK